MACPGEGGDTIPERSVPVAIKYRKKREGSVSTQNLPVLS